MNSGNYIVLMVFVFDAIAPAYSANILFGACVPTTPYTETQGASLVSCANYCSCLGGCEMFSYRRLEKACRLYTAGVEIGDAEPECRHDVVAYLDDFRTFSRIGLAPSCISHSMVNCPYFEVDDNTIRLGNRNHMTLSTVIVCEPTYALVKIDNSSCQESGEWSPIGNCTKVCPRPTPNPYMSFTGVSTMDRHTGMPLLTTWDAALAADIPMFESTVITLQCASHTRHYGPGEIRCIAGSWTDFPGGISCKPSTMRESCGSNEDCVDFDSECSSGTCVCKRDYSHHNASVSCVRRCPGAYGSTYQVHPGYQIWSRDQFETPVPNIEQCKALCASRNSNGYTCFSADFVTVWMPWPPYPTKTCYLNEDVPLSVRATPTILNAVYIQRDCAN